MNAPVHRHLHNSERPLCAGLSNRYMCHWTGAPVSPASTDKLWSTVMPPKFAFVLIAGFTLIAWPQSSARAQTTPSGIVDASTATASRDASRKSIAAAHPRKARYWRHRGGKHPHYGSRRARNR